MRTHKELQKDFEYDDIESFLADCKTEEFAKLYKTQALCASNYKAISMQTIVQQCKHLTEQQQQQLEAVLAKYPQLFGNKLCKYLQQIHLEIDKTIKPSFQRHYPIPHHNLQAFW